LKASRYTFLQILSVSVFEKTSISCDLQTDAYTTAPPDCGSSSFSVENNIHNWSR
jgi:hypothetical protein